MCFTVLHLPHLTHFTYSTISQSPLVVFVLDMTGKQTFTVRKESDGEIRVASHSVSAFTLLEGSCWKWTLSIIAQRVMDQGISCLLCFFQKADGKVSRKVASLSHRARLNHSKQSRLRLPKGSTLEMLWRIFQCCIFYALNTIHVCYVYLNWWQWI